MWYSFWTYIDDTTHAVVCICITEIRCGVSVSKLAIIYFVVSALCGIPAIIMAWGTGTSLIFLLAAAYGYFAARFIDTLEGDSDE